MMQHHSNMSTEEMRSASSESSSWMAPLGERRDDNRPSPAPSSAGMSVKSLTNHLFSPPGSSSSIKSALTTCSSPPSSGILEATLHAMAGTSGDSSSDLHVTTKPSFLTMKEMVSENRESSIQSKNMRPPSLDVIAAHLKNISMAEYAQSQPPHNDENVNVYNAANSTSPAKRGRSEALASLRDRAVNRSRSSSPVKRAVSHGVPTRVAASHSSAHTHVPTLEEIVIHLGKREAGPSTTQMQTSGEMSPSVAPSPIMSAPPSPAPIHNLANGLPPGFNNDLLTPSKTRSKAQAYAEWRKAELSRHPNDHPLQHAWGIYFDCKTWAPSISPSKKGGSIPSDAHDAQAWESVLRLLGHFVTVESFMSVFRTLRRPSQLERNSSYHLFKNGIKPMWEDPANAKGGKWIVTLRAGNTALLDRSWMWLVLALIGEDLDEDDDITGAVVSTRAKGDRIALWIRDKASIEKVNHIGQRFLRLLELEKEPGISLEFSSNCGKSEREAPHGEPLFRVENLAMKHGQDAASNIADGGSRSALSRVSSDRQIQPSTLRAPVDHSRRAVTPEPVDGDILVPPPPSRSPSLPLASYLGASPSKGFVSSLRASNNLHAAASRNAQSLGPLPGSCSSSPIKMGRGNPGLGLFRASGSGTHLKISSQR